jgi:hypothetical protein
MAKTDELQLELAEELLQYHDDPYGFVMFAYPWGQPGPLENYDGPDVWQRDFLLELGRQVKERAFDGLNAVDPIRMAVPSGHGVGKSTLVAWLTDWIMSTRPHAQGTVTANTFPQLETKTWAAIQKWTKMCITRSWFEITSDSVYFRGKFDSWRVSAQSSKEGNSESFAGQHAADSTSFYVFDEASAIPDVIWQVAFGGLTDGEPMFFAFGNPTRNSGQFHRACFGADRNLWKLFPVDSRTSKFANKALIQEWIETYGINSDFVKVRVRGECPSAGFAQFIPSDIVAAARKYKAEGYQTLPKVLSVDPARFGDDRTAIGLRQGRRFEIKAKLSKLDTVQVAERVIELIDSLEPDAVVVDGDGLGAGVVDQLKHRNYGRHLHEFHGGETPSDPNKYFNKRAECWGLTLDWLKAGAQIDDDHELETDLCGPEYFFSPKSQIQLERKQDLKARGLASPDLGDCLAMSFSVTVRAKPQQKPQNLVYSFPSSNAADWMRA